MRALLWKEGRENLFKILSGIGGCVIIHLLRLQEDFNQGFYSRSRGIEVWLLLLGIISSLMLGMDAVAGERSKGTLNFILGKPISPLRVLLPKFLVGAIALLLITATFWGVAYLTPPSERGLIGARILEDVSYFRMVLMWFVLFLVVYGFAFLASAVTDRPSTAMTGGLLAGMVLMFLLAGVIKVNPPLEDYLQILPEFDSDGRIVRIAQSAPFLLGRTGFGAILVAGLFGLTVILLTRCREFTLGWRTVLIGWVVGVFLSWMAGNFLKAENRATMRNVATPTGILHFEPKEHPALKDRLAHMTARYRLEKEFPPPPAPS